MINIPNNMDQKKAALLNNFAAMAKNKTNNDMLPLLLAFSNKAKKEGISFTPDETNHVIEILKKDLKPEEQKKLDVFLQMLK